jgi:hypothetical protein
MHDNNTPIFMINQYRFTLGISLFLKAVSRMTLQYQEEIKKKYYKWYQKLMEVE